MHTTKKQHLNNLTGANEMAPNGANRGGPSQSSASGQPVEVRPWATRYEKQERNRTGDGTVRIDTLITQRSGAWIVEITQDGWVVAILRFDTYAEAYEAEKDERRRRM